MMRMLMGVLLVLASGWGAALPASPRLETVVDVLEHPWSVALLPNERMLVIERPGVVKGAPRGQEVFFADHGQRMGDVRVSPDGALYLLTDEVQGALRRIVPL